MILVEEKDTRFYLKKSNIPNAGVGVFAAEPVKSGSVIEIVGVYVKIDSITDKCTEFAKDYKFAAGCTQDRFNRHIIPMGFAAIINHALNPEDQNVQINFVHGPKKNTNSGKGVYQFIRDVRQDEEILGHYGDNWNEVLTWTTDSLAIASESVEEWAIFLSYSLYGLDEMLPRTNV